MVAGNDPAPQHRTRVDRPRPLPLFLDMVAQVAASDPDRAATALAGLRRYQSAPRITRPVRRAVSCVGRTSVRACGESGPPVLLVPSLINPADVLDMDAETSLLGWLAGQGYRAMLLDWGTPDKAEADCGIADHISRYLLPVLADLGEPVHLVGYCLGGTMALAAAQIAPVRSLTLLATPWHFSGYPADARAMLSDLWSTNAAIIAAMGQMPMELLQTAFWGLDPDRTVSKFTALADMEGDDPRLARFVAIEDWANDGPPLTAAAAQDLLIAFMQDDAPGNGKWRVEDRVIDPASLTIPARHFTAHGDRIAPVKTACRAVSAHACPSGHVGMIIGNQARAQTFAPLRDWLATQ